MSFCGQHLRSTPVGSWRETPPLRSGVQLHGSTDLCLRAPVVSTLVMQHYRPPVSDPYVALTPQLNAASMAPSCSASRNLPNSSSSPTLLVPSKSQHSYVFLPLSSSRAHTPRRRAPTPCAQRPPDGMSGFVALCQSTTLPAAPSWETRCCLTSHVLSRRSCRAAVDFVSALPRHRSWSDVGSEQRASAPRRHRSDVFHAPLSSMCRSASPGLVRISAKASPQSTESV